MSYILEKDYIEKNYEKFHKEMWVKEDLSFTYFVLWNIFSELDIYNIDEEIIVDWSEDKQIDAVYINKDKNEINILQVKKSNKWFSSNIIIQIWNWLKWFFKDKEEVSKLWNIKLREKILESRDLDWSLSDFTINVFYCNLADSDSISKETNDEIDNIKNEYTKIYNNFNFFIIWAKELYKNIKKIDKKEISDEFEYNPNSLIKLDIDDYTKSIIIPLSTSEIAKLVEKYWDDLFEQNIRFALWDNKVNKKIYETATWDEKDYFWYYNNWITIICDSFNETIKPDKSFIKLKNLQIVNWCQTSTTLYKALYDWRLKNSYVLVKIYSSKDEDFINKITEATNSQTSINSRDLAANEKTQILIDDVFQKWGYSYERKRNQYKWKIINQNKKINNEKLWQAVMSIILKKPSKARSNKGAVFINEFYEKIFNRRIEELLLSFLIFDFSEKKRKTVNISEDIKTQIATYGTFHISRIIWELIFKEDITKINKDILRWFIKNIESDSLYLEEKYKKAISIIKDLLKEYQGKEEIFSFTNLFKRTDTENLINKYMKNNKINL